MASSAPTSSSTPEITRALTGGLVQDVSDQVVPEGSWLHARNAINRTHLGDAYVLSTEPGNELLQGQVPFQLVGLIYRSESTWVCFSSDEQTSEIGLFDELRQVYTPVVQSAELNFSAQHLITGVCKLEYDQTWAVYWRDSRNADRWLNLSRVPFRTSGRNLSPDPACFVPEYTLELDVDELLLHPKLTQPKLTLSKNPGAGQLSAGSYQAAVAYSVKGTRVSDYFVPSNVVSLWAHDGAGGALKLEVENLDSDFEEYELALLTTLAGQTTFHKVGTYSTRRAVVVLDQVQGSAETLDLRQLYAQHPVYHLSDGMASLNGYLLRWGVSTRPDPNYQPQANLIQASWVSVAYPADYYYHSGTHVSHLRDEVYAYFIRWVYNTGLKTASYHIPGRAAQPSDLANVLGQADALEGEYQAWQVLDTATSQAASGSLPDGGQLTARGQLQYWQSQERYPDRQPQIWGALCGQPLRHHKMPSLQVSPHVGAQGETIYVLGVEFSGITHPVDVQGQLILDIVGYEILRGSREGNKSVVASGLLANMGEYAIAGSTTRGLYQNYPYNDVRPDKFLLAQSEPAKGSAHPDPDQNPQSSFSKVHYSFHSPETVLAKPFLSGAYLQVYGELSGQVKGQFDYVHEHPKEKLITNFAFAQAVIVGLGLAVSAALGTGQMSTQLSAAPLGIGGSVTYTRNGGVATAIPDAIANLISSPVTTGSGLGLMLLSGAYWAGQGIEQALQIIYNLSPARQYALQYNSHGFYNSFQPAPAGQRRRSLVESGARYVGSFAQDISGTHRLNNWGRQPLVSLELSRSLDPPRQADTTRQRLQDAGLWKTPLREFTTQTSSHYGSLKVAATRQYGQLESIVQLPIHSGTLVSQPGQVSSSGVLFGGDVYISRYTEKNTYYYFRKWLTGKDLPDNYEYDYRLGLNGPAPRYWASFERFDLGDMGLDVRFGKGDSDNDDIDLGLVGISVGKPSDLHALDRNGSVNLDGIFSVNQAYFYAFSSGVRDFFVESEYNLSFRDYGEGPGERFYNPYDHYADLPQLFRADLLLQGELVRYDKSLSVSRLLQNYVSWASLLPPDYDPLTTPARTSYFPDRVIYSLPHQTGLKRDNWKVFLANNYRDFAGQHLTQLKALNATGALLLFANGEPRQFVGVDQLQTTGGVKLSIGDGGLLQQNYQSVVNADDALERGSCQSQFAVINCEHGCFWVSQKTSKIFRFAGEQAQDVTQLGMQRWFARHLPSELLRQFPRYSLFDNPVVGVGCLLSYDPTLELLYVSKRDFRLKAEFLGSLRYVAGEVGFRRLDGTPVALTDATYFEDCCWTISFDPKGGQQGQGSWLSFHDWRPEWSVSSYRHFLTTRQGSFYRHGSSTSSFATYYGQQFPFELELPLVSASQVSVVKSVEYWLEGQTYSGPQGQDRFDVAQAEFDEAYLYNAEQHSGLLALTPQNARNPVANLGFPKRVGNKQLILVSKVESQHRFNQFWDQTKLRQDPSQEPMFLREANGYSTSLNPAYFDYQKPPLERKRLRHYGNRLFLRKIAPGPVNYLFKLLSLKLGFSAR